MWIRSAICMGMLLSLTVSSVALAQREPATADLRALHEQVVYSTVQIVTPSAIGTGWLLAQSGRPLVVTNRHVAQHVGPRGAQVFFYAGAERAPVEVRATRFYLARTVDIGILRLESDPPATARALQMNTETRVVRGERIVLGGNPADPGNAAILPFQTTEGVVTGHIAGRAFDECGAGRNCVVVDAASFAGSSGGPAFSVSGQLVGMLWGGPVQATHVQIGVAAATSHGEIVAVAGESRTATHNPTFGYLIHVRTIADELRSLEARLGREAEARTPAPNLPQYPPRAEVTAALEAARERIARCATRGRARVTVIFRGATGEVAEVRIAETDLPRPVRSCIDAAIHTLRLQPFARARFEVTHPYPLGTPAGP